ncbi:GGDEF domain-containing protein [Marinobacter zhejiangensis]|nr:GGDEF domain-containing protein [Marinobacter zhejiangensis]
MATNPSLVVLGFRRQIVYHLHFWALVAVLPLVMVQWEQGHLLLSALLALFCVNAVLVIVCLRWWKFYFLQGWPFVLLAILSSTYSTVINGHAGLYWAYPAAAAVFFLLPLRSAIACNALFVVTMSVVSFQRFPEADFWRITFSLGLTCIFALIFAWLVGRLKEELVQIATTDPLTGCLNRSQLADMLNSQIQMRERYERVSSIVLLDLDYFKDINDRWGHVTGDRVLKEISARMKARLRESDKMFRIGGEEFMLVLPETRQREAEQLTQQLLINIASSPLIDNIMATASAGVTEVKKGDTWSTWLNRADQALYQAKHRGRNCLVGGQEPIQASATIVSPAS